MSVFNSTHDNALNIFLDKHWQLWRQHVGSPRHHDMIKAFAAGYISGMADGAQMSKVGADVNMIRNHFLGLANDK